MTGNAIKRNAAETYRLCRLAIKPRRVSNESHVETVFRLLFRELFGTAIQLGTIAMQFRGETAEFIEIEQDKELF